MTGATQTLPAELEDLTFKGFVNRYHSEPDTVNREIAGHRVVVREETNNTGCLEVYAPEGEIQLSIELTTQGAVVRISGVPLQLDLDQSCDIRCKGKLSLAAQEGVEITSGKEMIIKAKEDIKMNGSLIHLNDPRYSPRHGHDQHQDVPMKRVATRRPGMGLLSCILLLCLTVVLTGCSSIKKKLSKIFKDDEPKITWKNGEVDWIKTCRDQLKGNGTSPCDSALHTLSIKVLDEYKGLVESTRTNEMDFTKLSDVLAGNPDDMSDPLLSWRLWQSDLPEKLSSLKASRDLRARLVGQYDQYGQAIGAETTSVAVTYADVEMLHPLAALPGLTELSLAGNDRLTDICPLSKLGKLRKLDLSETAVSDLSPLKHCKNLQELRIRGNEKIQSLVGLRECSSLRVLRLDGCRSLTDLSGLENLENLEVISLYNCGQIKSLAPLGQAKRLKQIDVRGIRTNKDAIVGLVLDILRGTDGRAVKVILDDVKLSPGERGTIAADIVNAHLGSGTEFVFQNMVITGSGIVVLL